MRYAKLSCINASQLTYSLIGLLAMARRIIYGLSVLLFRSFLGTGSFVFSETQRGSRGLGRVVHDRVRFFENRALPPNCGKQAKSRVI